MQKSAFSPSCSRNERTQRLAYLLAAFGLGLSLSVPLGSAPVWSESGHDLNITKDGGNVNVNLNTATSSDVSIRRSDDIMVIKVPKSYKGNVNIDPALKKNSVVHEEEIPSGRAITIQSQQIYLHTWDGESNAPANPPASSHPDRQSEKPAGKAAAEAKSNSESEKSAENNSDGSKEDVGPTKGGILKLSPNNESSVGANAPAESTHTQSTHITSKSPKHHQAETVIPTGHRPLDITRLFEQNGLLNNPATTASKHRNHKPIFAHPEVSLDNSNPTHLKQVDSTENTAPLQIRTPKMASTIRNRSR